MVTANGWGRTLEREFASIYSQAENIYDTSHILWLTFFQVFRRRISYDIVKSSCLILSVCLRKRKTEVTIVPGLSYVTGDGLSTLNPPYPYGNKQEKLLSEQLGFSLDPSEKVPSTDLRGYSFTKSLLFTEELSPRLSRCNCRASCRVQIQTRSGNRL